METESVRAVGIDESWLQRQEGFHGVELSEHGGTEDIDACAA